MGKSAMATAGLVSLLLLVHLLLGVSSLLGKSATFDEPIHLAAGYSYWIRNDYRLQPENGNLPQRLAALPLLFSRPAFPSEQTDGWTRQDVWAVAHQFLYQTGNDPGAILRQGRIMILLLSLILGLLVFQWTSLLFGGKGGLLALGLYCFSPTILAHARLATSDSISALFFISALYLLWAVMHRVDGKTLIGAGLAVSGLILSKMSGVLIAPVSLVLVGVRIMGRKALHVDFGLKLKVRSRWSQAAVLACVAVVITVISVTTIWGFYGFRFTAAADLPEGASLSYPGWDSELSGAGRLAPAIRILRDNRVLPEAYLYGFSYVLSHARTRPAFLYGDYSLHGWWYFFPFSFAIKTPLAIILTLCLSMIALAMKRSWSVWYALTPLIVFISVYGAVAMGASINIGHRHILVLYPALFILSGGAVLWFQLRKGAFVRIVAPLLVSACLLESVLIWPDYLAFFNAAAGGPRNGYRLLVDSSLDWGQDLPGLKRWIHENISKSDPIELPLYLAYFGTANPAQLGIEAKMLVFRKFPWLSDIDEAESGLGPGIYCISATALQQVYGVFGRWGKEHERDYRILNRLEGEMTRARSDPRLWDQFVKECEGVREISRLLHYLRELRFARLCRTLLQREPDDYVGYSILIYYVTPKELWRALMLPLETGG